MVEAHAWANNELFRCKSFLTKDGLFSIIDRSTHVREFHLSTWRSYPLLPGKGGWAPHPVPQGKGCGHSKVPFTMCSWESIPTSVRISWVVRELAFTIHHLLPALGRHHAVSSGQFLIISAPILWGRFCYCLYLTVKKMKSPMWNICNPQVSPCSKRQTHYSIFNRLSDLLLSP